MPGGRIFLNYRREDSAGYARSIFDRLNARFTKQVFMDVDVLEPGVDFVEAIEQAVGSCDALIVLIGKRWLDITGTYSTGVRRLDDPRDFVRLEIATALKRNVRVIPALVGGATMPSNEQLPEDLQSLTRRQALQVTDQDWDHDVERLITTLERVLDVRPKPEPEPKKVEAEDQSTVLRRQALAALHREDWPAAISMLRQYMALNPRDGAAAGDLRWALGQQKLAELYASGRQLLQSGRKAEALDVFRRVRAQKADYRDVNQLVASLEAEVRPLVEPIPVPPPGPPRPTDRKTRRRALPIGIGAAVVVVSLIITGVIFQNRPKPSYTSPPIDSSGSDSTGNYGRPSPPPDQTPKGQPEPVSGAQLAGTWSAVVSAVGQPQVYEVVEIDPNYAFRVMLQGNVIADGNWQYDPGSNMLVFTGRSFLSPGVQWRCTLQATSSARQNFNGPCSDSTGFAWNSELSRE